MLIAHLAFPAGRILCDRASHWSRPMRRSCDDRGGEQAGGRRGVHAWARAGVRPLETPASAEAEFLRATEHEVDDGLRIAGRVIANPELCPAVLGLDG